MEDIKEFMDKNYPDYTSAVDVMVDQDIELGRNSFVIAEIQKELGELRKENAELKAKVETWRTLFETFQVPMPKDMYQSEEIWETKDGERYDIAPPLRDKDIKVIPPVET